MEEILMKILAAVLMVVFFGLCIIIHEFGHFLAARLCGLHVIAFSVGFKKIWGKKIGGVEYRIGCLPFGGYVDLPQIDASGEAKDENGNVLPKAEPWKRIVTAFAGPLFNVLFGLFLGCFIWWFGLPQDSPLMDEIKVQSVETESPEYKAGLRPGDVIVKLNGKELKTTWNDFVRDVMLTVGGVDLTVRRDGKTFSVKYNPIVNPSISPEEKIPYPFFKPEVPIEIYPLDGSPAKEAGLLPGDRILKVNGSPVYSYDEFVSRVLYSNGTPMTLSIQRNNAEKTITVTPRAVPGAESVCLIGIQFDGNGTGVHSTISGLPAEGKLFPGDQILRLDGKDVTREEFQTAIRVDGEKEHKMTVQRKDKTLEIVLAPVKIIPHQIGVQFYTLKHPSPFKQLTNVIVMTGKSLKSLTAGIKRQMGLNAGYTVVGPQHLSGPGGIGRILFVTFYRGSFLVGLNVVVIISFSLGLFNLLPIPVLDGGHILLAVLEMIFRRPVPAKVLQPIMIFFVTILIGFMIYVTFYDVQKMLPGSLKPVKKPVLSEKNAEEPHAAPSK